MRPFSKLLALAALLVSCSHQPTKPIDPVVSGQLHDQFKDLIARELSSRPDIKQVKNIKITRAAPGDNGSLLLDYEATFESTSKDLGDVDHDFSGTAKLVEKSENKWVVDSIERKSQALIFHQSEPVVGTPEKKAPTNP